MKTLCVRARRTHRKGVGRRAGATSESLMTGPVLDVERTGGREGLAYGCEWARKRVRTFFSRANLIKKCELAK